MRLEQRSRQSEDWARYVGREFSGGPEPTVNRFTRWLRPRGGSVSDGVRLAAINTLGLVVTVIWVATISLITRLLDNVVPLPVVFTGFFAVLVALGVGTWVWYRYGSAHGKAARAMGADPRSDVFSAIGTLPFVAVAVALLSFGILGLFVAAITFSGSRLADSLQQLGFAVLFLGFAAASLLTVRASSGGMSRGT